MPAREEGNISSTEMLTSLIILASVDCGAFNQLLSRQTLLSQPLFSKVCSSPSLGMLASPQVLLSLTPACHEARTPRSKQRGKESWNRFPLFSWLHLSIDHFTHVQRASWFSYQVLFSLFPTSLIPPPPCKSLSPIHAFLFHFVILI